MRAPIVRFLVGAVPEQLLGALGSQERVSREDQLLTVLAETLSVHLQFLSWGSAAHRGGSLCYLEGQFRDTLGATAARQNLVDIGELVLTVSGQQLQVQAQQRAHRRGLNQTVLRVRNLPPQLRKQGLTALLLRSVHQCAERSEVHAEFAPQIQTTEGTQLPVLRGDLLVAHVTCSSAVLAALPRKFFFAGRLTTIQVTPAASSSNHQPRHHRQRQSQPVRQPTRHLQQPVQVVQNTDTQPGPFQPADVPCSSSTPLASAANTPPTARHTANSPATEPSNTAPSHQAQPSNSSYAGVNPPVQQPAPTTCTPATQPAMPTTSDGPPPSNSPHPTPSTALTHTATVTTARTNKAPQHSATLPRRSTRARRPPTPYWNTTPLSRLPAARAGAVQ